MRQSARDRYKNDVEFHQLVAMLEMFVHRAQFTPSELREAVVLASIMFEERRIRTNMIALTPELQKQLSDFSAMVNERHPD